MSRRAILGGLAFAVAGATLGTGTAWAAGANYGHSVVEGGITTAQSKGTLSVSTTIAQDAFYIRDAQPGGYGVFNNTTFLFLEDNYSGGQSWNNYGSKKTPDYTTSSWTWNRRYYSLPGSGYSARLSSKVCVNKPSAPDACSPSAIYTQNY